MCILFIFARIKLELCDLKNDYIKKKFSKSSKRNFVLKQSEVKIKN